MKKICLTFRIMLILMMFHAMAAAEVKADAYKDYYLGGTLDYALDRIHENSIANKFTQPIDVSFDNAFGARVWGGMEIKDYLYAEVMAELMSPFQDTKDNKTAEVNARNLGLNLKMIMAYWGNYEPYVLTGLGLMYSTMDITFGEQEYSDSDWGLDFKIGLGVDYNMTPEMFMKLETVYTNGLGSPHYVRYQTISLGMGYRF